MSAEILVTVGADGTLELTTSAALQTIEVASAGPEGPGAPRGGATNQVVAKASDADLDFKFVTLTPQFVGAEPAVTSGTTSDYWRGDKTWRNFFADVRAATLTGLSTAVNAVVTAADTVLSAIGKLQAQVTGLASSKLDVAATSFGGNAATATKLQTARTINGTSFDGSANITITDDTKLPLAGGTLTGKLTTAASAAGRAGFNIPHGTAPTTPSNGDVWTTTSGVFVRVNGATKTVAFKDSIVTGNAIVNVGPVDGVAVIYSGISTEHVIVLKVEVNAGANDRYDIEIYDGAISDGGTLVYRAQQVQGNYLDNFAFYHQCQNTDLHARVVNLRQDGASFNANVKIALMLG